MIPAGQLQVQAGTYIKVTTVPGTPSGGRDDSYRILYLRPSGTFLFLGYWSGFEQTSVVGRWFVEVGAPESMSEGSNSRRNISVPARLRL